jgi:hypothetical protein
VYHARLISEESFSAAEYRRAGEGRSTAYSRGFRGILLHTVFSGRGTAGRFAKIRNSGFSDLRRNEREQALL